MAPRIQSRSVSTLLPYLTSSSTSKSSSIPSLCSSSQSSRQFSVSAAQQTKLRRQMFEWLATQGSGLKHHVPGETNYLKWADGTQNNRPFPNNPNFVSESILSEELRNEVYVRVIEKKKSPRAVSVELGIDMNRIAAVVRLVELERRQREKGKSLALPYARAVHEMVPTTPLAPAGERQTYHEPINDLPVHPATGAQIFYPVPESRSFTRVDAGRVFSGAPALEKDVSDKITHPSDLAENLIQRPGAIEWVGKGDNARQVLQPADVRIPHPQLVQLARDRAAHPEERRTVAYRHAERLERQEKAEKQRLQRSQQRRAMNEETVKPQGSRFSFRIKDAVVTKESVGKDGRAPWAPGRRYGVPTNDRKRGTVKIPTRVEI
ncbi:hypothetical protein N7532_006496 [Penicillium argentinense]|uniref:Ribosomal protein S35, mitochondrial n=1 Tax=Penicillium argentinense TaxID=1131581 RepID=A0A9W9KAX0_9EURO|nr:uncharacterized protein N7532_006496 [Penicillium argentinense]KAJ5099495.1 hypothetical protein N7532_006496 [Penicillium argentinense]